MSLRSHYKVYSWSLNERRLRERLISRYAKAKYSEIDARFTVNNGFDEL